MRERAAMERQNLRVDVLLASHVWEPLPTTRWGLSGAIFRSTPVWRMYVSPLYLPLYTALAPPTPFLNLHHCGEKELISFCNLTTVNLGLRCCSCGVVDSKAQAGTPINTPRTRPWCRIPLLATY